MKLSVIGTGKLGLSMVAYYASRGHDIIGLDYNAGLIAALNKGQCPVNETGLARLLEQVHSKIQFTQDYTKAVMGSDISFIIVPTPSEKSGKFSNKYVMAAVAEIAKVLREKDEYHLVVVTSTVMPGTCEGLVKPALEALSGKKCGEAFGLIYNPEFIALGSVLRDMAEPDAMLMGQSDERAGMMLEEFHRQATKNDPAMHRMSLWNAEFAKIALNVSLTLKISLGNSIEQVCDAMPTGDADIVSAFLGSDSRIGPKLLKGALGYGGTCLGRDNRAFIVMARKLGVRTPLQQGTDLFNHMHSEWVVNKAEGLLRNGRVAVLGLTYKPNTCIVEDSMSLDIARRLAKHGYSVSVHDPQGLENAERELGGMVRYCNSIYDCLRGVELCILATPWSQFKKVQPFALKDVMAAPVVLDCWRFWDRKKFEDAGVKYFALGVHNG